ncbi:MAG: hypothetical protein JW862_17345 [Anaerolineales bacterium]|nr:hypothetical protein [Anaerolineales bacterium]
MTRQRSLLLVVICSAFLLASWPVRPGHAVPQSVVLQSYTFESPGGYSSQHPPGSFYPEFSAGGDVFGRVETNDSNWGGGWGARTGSWFFGWRDSDAVDPGTTQAFVFVSDPIDISAYEQVSVSFHWRVQGLYSPAGPDFLRAYLICDGVVQPDFFAPTSEMLNNSYLWQEVSVPVPTGAQQFQLVIAALSTSGSKKMAIDDIAISQHPVTPHSIMVDGDLADWSPYTERLGQRGNQSYYLTWDADYLYAAISDPFAATGNQYCLAVDVDPGLQGSANSGSAAEYQGASWPAASDYGNKPDYVLCSSTAGQESARAVQGTWSAWHPSLSSVGRGCDHQCAEWRFNWLEVGIGTSDLPVGVYFWAVTEDSGYVYASWPPENRQTNVIFYAYSHVPGALAGRAPAQVVQRRAAERQVVVYRGNHSFLNGWVKLLNVQSQGSCEVLVSLVANGNVTGGVDDFQRLVQIERALDCLPGSATFELLYEARELGRADDEMTLLVYQWGSWFEAPGNGYVRDPFANTVQRLGFELPPGGELATYTLGSAQPTQLQVIKLEARQAGWFNFWYFCVVCVGLRKIYTWFSLCSPRSLRLDYLSALISKPPGAGR